MAIKMRKACPECGGTQFTVSSVLVAQNWTVDGNGNRIKCLDQESTVMHEADDEDEWKCTACGYCAKGSEFNVPSDKVLLDALNEIIKIASSVEDLEKIEDIKQYAANLKKEILQDLHYSNTFIVTSSEGGEDIFERLDGMLEFRFLNDYEETETSRKYIEAYGESAMSVIAVTESPNEVKVSIEATGKVVFELNRKLPESSDVAVYNDKDCLEQLCEVAFHHFI